MLPAILIATANRHKTDEFRALLAGRATVDDLHDHPSVGQAEETGATFAENSALKAVAAARASGRPAVADDSGLEVDALGGAPGVWSSRYAGPDADDRANRAKLLADLDRVGATDPARRRGRFRCVLTLALPDGTVAGQWTGAVEGTILAEERGSGGFGYDALFLPDGRSRSFGELPAAEKNQLSHRARAAARMVADWDRIAPRL